METAAGRPGACPPGRRGRALALALACALAAPAGATEWRTFSSEGLPGSRGLVVRVSHPAQWKPVLADDAQALAELRGPLGEITGILQIGRGARQRDMDGLCRPERAATMLQGLSGEAGTRVTEVLARRHGERPAFDLRYERNAAPDFLRVHGLVVCLKDTRLLVSCAGLGPRKAALAGIDPVCRQLLASVTVSEE